MSYLGEKSLKESEWMSFVPKGLTLEDLEPVLLWSCADFCKGLEGFGLGSVGCEVSAPQRTLMLQSERNHRNHCMNGQDCVLIKLCL